MSYFTPTKIAVGGKELFNKWRRERQRALQNSSDAPELEETSKRITPRSPNDLEPDLSPIEVGSTNSETRSRSRARALKKIEAAPMSNSALSTVSTPFAMKLARSVNSEPRELSTLLSPLTPLHRGFIANQAPAAPETDAIKSVGYDGHASDNVDSGHGETSGDEEFDPDSETEPAEDASSADDQTTTKEPAIWDPPFSTPPHARSATRRQSKTPTQTPRSSLRRSVRKASPVADAPSEDQDDDAPREDQDNGAPRDDHDDDDKQGPDAPDSADEQEQLTKRYKFSSIKDHRPSPGNPNLFELLIRWSSDGSTDDLETWEPEDNIHRDAPRGLFSYWRSVGGREAHMEDPGLWHIADVKKHRVQRGKVQLLVSWIGSGDDSWEPEEMVAESAQAILDEYWESRGGREKYLKKAVTKTGGAKKRKRETTVVKKGTAKRTRR